MIGVGLLRLTVASVAVLAMSGAARAQTQKPVPVSRRARADERVDRRADQEGLAERRADPRDQLRRRASERVAGRDRVVVGRQRAVGSGFVIDPDGYIMTNAHVVANAQRVQVLLPPTKADGSLATALSPKMNIVPARIVGISSEIDLALLKVDGLKLPALTLATYSQVRQGETVFAFGSPSGLRHTLTHGLVSAVARQTDPDSPLIYLQTDAPINPGNSGGPLVNVRGEVVGINTFIISQSGGSDGLGFAIPSATIRTAFRQLRQYGQLRRQEVGMSLQTITPEMAGGLGLARDYGVIVSDVWPRGPAEAAGLQPGDILVSVDGQPAENLPTVNYNFRLRDSTEKVQLVVLRGTTRADAERHRRRAEERVRLDGLAGRPGEEPGAGARHPRRRDRSARRDMAQRPAGTRTASSSPRARPAREARCRCMPRDVIRSLNNTKMFTLDQLRNALRALKPGAPVTLQIQREGR